MAYMTTSDFESRNDITLNSTDFPTTALVQEWIDDTTSEINGEIGRTFDKGEVTDSLPVEQSTQVFFIKSPPIDTSESFSAVYNSTYSEFETPTWTNATISVVDASIGAVKFNTPQAYRSGDAVKITYTGGYDTVPYTVKKLCRLIVQREYTDTQLQQEIGDATVTSIASIRVSEKSASGMKLQLERLDKKIESAWEDLKSQHYIGTFEGMY